MIKCPEIYKNLKFGIWTLALNLKFELWQQIQSVALDDLIPNHCKIYSWASLKPLLTTSWDPDAPQHRKLNSTAVIKQFRQKWSQSSLLDSADNILQIQGIFGSDSL